MKSWQRARQSGSALIMIIGVVAALAVMATTLVAVVINTQANTADSRVRNQAQGVAEAAMDAQMYALAKDWPETATPSPTPTMDAGVVRSQFAAGEFPDGPGGKFASAIYYDNSDTNNDGKVTSADAKWDANDDRIMVVEAQANVGDRASRVTGMVERTFVSTIFPRGVVVYDGGNMTSNGSGNQIRVYNPGDPPQAVTAQVGGTLQSGSVFGSGISVTTTSTGAITPWDQIVPTTTVQQVVAMAKGLGTFYDLTAGAIKPTTEADFEGVVVIKANPGEVIDLPQSSGINMLRDVGAVPAATDEPGILFIYTGAPASAPVIVRAQGHTNYYGIFYSDGQLGEATGQSYSGTPSFYGQVICKTFMDVRGTCNILYDDSAIMKLRDRYTLTVVLVSNTWREISPK